MTVAKPGKKKVLSNMDVFDFAGQQSIELNDDPSVMMASAAKATRITQTAQTKYRKESRKHRMDENRTQYLQGVLKKLF